MSGNKKRRALAVKEVCENSHPSGPDFIAYGCAIVKFREKYGLSQSFAAPRFNVSVRRLQQYESTTKPVWSTEAKRIVFDYPDIFSFTLMEKITKRRWTNRRSLVNELWRHVNGETQRKRYESKPEMVEPDLMSLLNQIRHKYGTKIRLTDKTIEFFHFGDGNQQMRLLEKFLE